MSEADVSGAFRNVRVDPDPSSQLSLHRRISGRD